MLHLGIATSLLFSHNESVQAQDSWHIARHLQLLKVAGTDIN